MRQALVYRKNILAGTLTEDEGEYSFIYDSGYLRQDNSRPISPTMPMREQSYVSPTLHPFFDGLIPEGWLLDVAIRNTDISILDRMSLLLLCCRDCIGSVSIIEKAENDV